MRFTILVMVLYLSPLLWRGAGGEVYAQQPQLDSLYKLIANHQSADAVQLKLLLAIADAQELSNQTKGIAAADKAIELAQKLNKQQELAIAYNLKARLFIMKQLPDKANDELQKSIEINRKLNNQNQLAENTLTMAQFIICQQKSDTTINYINKSQTLFANSTDNLIRGKIFFFYASYYSFSNPDTSLILKRKAKIYFEKTNRMDWLALTEFHIATYYTSLNNNAKALEYFQVVEKLNQIIKSEFLAENIFCTRGYLYSSMAEHPKALDNFITGLKIAETIGDEGMQAAMLNNIGTAFGEMGDLERARQYIDKQILLATKINDKSLLSLGYQNIGNIYFEQQKYKDALPNAERSLKLALEAQQPDHIAESYGLLGKVYEKLGMYNDAFNNLQLALASNKQQGNYYNICENLLTLSRAIKNSGTLKFTDAIGGAFNDNLKIDKAIEYTEEALYLSDTIGALAMKRDALRQLSDLYKVKQDDKKSFDYFKQYVAAKDSIMSSENLKSINDLQLKFETEKREQQIVLLNKDKEIQQKEISKKKTERNGFVSGFALVLMISGVTYNRYRVKQKANEKLSVTLTQLKEAQQKLIEQEKLASLGQLTAGIAHEIQNPLNFVINFSQLSNDLFKDLENSNDTNEQQEIIADLEDNLSKIERHGTRADGIIQSMLMHSRNTSTEKQLTNLNELCSEAFNFSWQAMLIQHEGFKCEQKIDFDKSLPPINLIPQEISRVIINLLNNAFYAVHEKSLKLQSEYKPAVEVITKLSNQQIIISITDNGSGIPDEIKSKIFQPFFTTKPTNLGTGLGLSISYDIIKAHNGTLILENSSDSGTTFTIALPV